VAALVGEIGHQSRILAMARGGRLEPPLTLVLDEAANICPIPLHRWTSFMGGHNITLTASFQDPTQIASIWGADAQSIRDHAACLVVFGGIEDSRFLEECVRKCDIIEDPTNGGVQQRVTTITPAEIMSLPAHRALVFRTGMSHVIVTAPNIYKRREFRRRSRAIAVPLDVTETRYAEKLADAPTGE
jgi:type IV secretory pathway TraG/TraD family ATPase VirD4